MCKVLAVFFLFVFFQYSPLALIGFSDAVFPELATSGRALAMGNAFVAKVNDSSAAFYNPAGLGSVRFAHLHLSNIHMEVNRGWMDVSTGGGLLDIVTNFPNGFSLDGIRQNLLNKTGTISNARFQVVPNFTSRYATLGFLLSSRTKATVGTGAGGLFQYADRLDYGPYAGFNISIGGGVIKLGAMGILLRREEAIGESDANTTIDLQSGDYSKGFGMIFNAGIKMTAPIMWLPTLSLNMHNATGTSFSASGAGAPSAIGSSMDVGFAITPGIGKNSRFHIELDYKDVTSAYADVSVNRKILLGFEMDFARVFYVRLGYGDGYGSAGFGIKTRKLEFDFTTYAVDTTTSDFRGQEDRRFSMTISSGF